MHNRTLFREMDKFQHQFDQMLQGMGLRRLVDESFMPGLEFQRSPRVNLTDEGENFVVEALLPGVSIDDLEMTVQNNTLILSGERKAEEEREPAGTWHRKERKAGKFQRTIELPVDIDQDRAGAEYRDGILRVTLPKAEAAKPKRIVVRAN